ncbi:MAG TPA: A/G-specific adenine glycosylase [Chitinophagaceae bacterium]|nr:A/G-specific adenine glycosylase [Chitinophagaceae bacterium]
MPDKKLNFRNFADMHYEKFKKLLLQWHQNENKRQMPWKGEKDPYKVWLSEVILQQTRVEQGWVYYERFIKKYPGIQQLAEARDEDVFKLWEGLGYYTRCKNLLHTARFIVNEYNGKFPDSYEKIASFKGIGPYTAAAIASFCFDLPYAVVDGNVFRILSRVFGIATPIDSAEGRKIFVELATKVLDKKNSALFNQAIMDFGATVCKPVMPVCSTCSLNLICVAFKNAKVNALPVKEKVLKKKLRWFSYFVMEAKNKIFVRKRTGKDIWQNLFEFYLAETDDNPVWSNESAADFLKNQFNIQQFAIEEIRPAIPQHLTHQHIKGYFIRVQLTDIPRILCSEKNQWIEPQSMKRFAFPGFINQYIQNKKMQMILF